MEEKPINGKAIYTPKGAALEYGRIGCNFYTGCPHDCDYCYLKRGITSKTLGGTEVKLKKCFKDKRHAISVFLSELNKWFWQCREYGIFFSFSTDPMIKETRDLTICATIAAAKEDIPVYILTKDATFIEDIDFGGYPAIIQQKFLKYIHFGFTLTGCDYMEPNASKNIDRIKAMKVLHDMGFKTFASIEPVIDWHKAIAMVMLSREFCDHYKVGLRSGVKKDYYKLDESSYGISNIIRLANEAGKTVYLKNSTRKLFDQCYFNEQYRERLLSETVDMDGNPYRKE